MKKILCLALLVGFAYPKTGNDFLENFPFSKRIEEMTTVEKNHNTYYRGVLHGVHEGTEYLLGYYYNTGYLTEAELLPGFMSSRTCNMTDDQLMRIIKKWCDENPEGTHLDFEEIIIKAILKMPVDKSCYK